MTSPEQRARIEIDRLLDAAGWKVQDRAEINIAAGRGVAVREVQVGGGFADYLLIADRKALGVIEAKAEGTTLSGVEVQSGKYTGGLPAGLRAWHLPLPFVYESTGVETYFTNGLDPAPRSRPVFAFHRPETLVRWATELPTLRARLRTMPPLATAGLWDAQVEAIQNLERSFAEDRPRALIQMATGSGKTFTAVSFVYRLIKHANATRVLFLVDRNNLGRQALREFQQYVTPDDGRKFTELYNVQHLQSNLLDPVSPVCITTIQRLYSMLAGDAELDPAEEEQALWVKEAELNRLPPRRAGYNAALPPEYFDFIISDECHRSIYTLWRGVLEYFDAYLVGLTATPSRQTFGFFNRNLVMEYSRQRAVADGVNVDGEVYRIRTRITESGSQVDAGYWVGRRDRRTRGRRWEQLDDDLAYAGSQLDRDVVAEDQIRTVIHTFRERLFTEIFPGRKEVPKTLIFAKDDSHAEDIVRIVREEFAQGNDFCQKITYKVTGVRAEELIATFRNSYNPRIAVTVDMIATGTDIRPLEVLLFMRNTDSRILFEQMTGRGTRVINSDDLQAVTPDALTKDRFVIVDAVGLVEKQKADNESLERKRAVSFDRLLEAVAMGAAGEDTVSSLAGRLARLERKLKPADEYAISAASGGLSLRDLAGRLVDALDPDRALDLARETTGCQAPGEEELAQAAAQLLEQAVEVFVARPQLRNVLKAIHEREEQTIDETSEDYVLAAGFSPEDTARARSTVVSFRQFIEEHKDEIAALQIIYNRPAAGKRLLFEQVKELAGRLQQPPNSWTTEALWRAYAQLQRDRVRDAGGKRTLTDLVALVRYAAGLDDQELEPYPERVRERYSEWLAAQQAAGRVFTPDQRKWLDRIAELIGVNLAVTQADIDEQLDDQGGWIAARRLFGSEFGVLLDR